MIKVLCLYSEYQQAREKVKYVKTLNMNTHTPSTLIFRDDEYIL